MLRLAHSRRMLSGPRTLLSIVFLLVRLTPVHSGRPVLPGSIDHYCRLCLVQNSLENRLRICNIRSGSGPADTGSLSNRLRSHARENQNLVHTCILTRYIANRLLREDYLLQHFL